MGIKRKFLKILSLFIVFSMLSNYMLICSEITDVVFATEFDEGFTSSLELNTEQNNEENGVEEIPSEEVASEENIDDALAGNEENIAQSDEEVNIPEANENNLSDEAKEDVPAIIDEGEESSKEELVDTDVADTSEFAMPESNLEHYLVNLDYDINRVSKFDNSSGKGVIVDGTFKININAQKKHNVKIEFNMPQINGISPIKYRIDKNYDNVTIEHNSDENKIALNIFEADENEEVRITFLYNEEAYDGEELSIKGSIYKEDYTDSDEQNYDLKDITEENDLQNETDNINLLDKNYLFEGEKFINIESALTKRFSTEQEIEILESDNNEVSENNIINENIEAKENDENIIVNENSEDININENINNEEAIEVDENEIIDAKEDFEISKKIESSQVSNGTYSIKSDYASRFKGMLYANLSVTNSKDIDYVTTDTIEVEDKDFIDYVEIVSKDKIINKENNEININNGILLKKMTISEEQFETILGEDGYIEIYDETNTKIGTIDKDTEKVNGKYIYKFPSLISNIKYNLVNVKNNGKIEIILDKVISKDINLSKEQILDIKSIVTENINRTRKTFDDIEVALQEINTQTEMILEDTKTEISLDIDNISLSSQKENDVSFNINLKTNSEEYETFKNPFIEVAFPYSIQDVQIEKVNLLHKNGLSLENWEVVKGEFGEVLLRIHLSGEQLEYNPSTIIDGTTISITTKVMVDRLNTEESGIIKLRYNNENSTKLSYEAQGKDSEEYEVKFVSNSELLTVTNLDSFNSNFDALSEINTDRLVGKADVGGEEKTSKVSLKIINNYKEDMNNVVIIGRLPVIGNVDNNGNSLNTTVDANLASEVITTGLVSKIYYSEELNEEINSENWKESVNDLSKVKCFKIEVSDGTMHQGESINISYSLNVPENLNYNESIYGLNSVYYKVGEVDRTKNIVVGLETDEKEITIDDFENVQDTEKLKIGTKVTRGGEEVTDGENINERQILRYTTIIENVSNETINNISLKGNAHNANMYYWYTYNVVSSSTGEDTLTGEWIEDTEKKHEYDELKIDSLEPGESRVFEYQVIVNDLTFLQDFNDKTVYGNINISADGIEEEKITTQKNPIIDSELEIRLLKGGLEDANYMVINSGEDYQLCVYLKNLSDKVLENFEVNLTVPSFIQYDPLMEVLHEEYIVSTKETSTSNIITVLIDGMEPGEDGILYFYMKIDEFDKNVMSLNAPSVADATVNGRKYISNDYSRVIHQAYTTYLTDFVGSKENGSVVEDGEELEYTFTAKNMGALEETALFEYFFQYGLNIKSIDLYREDETKENLYTQMEELEPNNSEQENNEEIKEIDPEALENETKNDYEVNEEEEIRANNENTDTYIADIYKDLDPTEVDYYEGYSEETNYYTKAIKIKSHETIKVVIKANVDLKKAIDHQESIVNTVNFRSETIEQSVTYYLKYEDEKEEESIQEDIIDEEPPMENPDEGEDILTTTILEDDTVIDENIIKDSEDVVNNEEELYEDNVTSDEEIIPDEEVQVEEEPQENLPDEEDTSNDQIVDENEDKTEDIEVENNEPKEVKVIKNVEEQNNNPGIIEEKTVVLDSVTTPVLKSPSKNIDSSKVENIASLNEDVVETHSISGTVWVDENKDGIPNKAENKVSNLKVQLYEESGEKAIKTTTTNKIGEYSFTGISKGNYVVVFAYDNELYNINTYDDESNKELTNIISNRTIDGKKYGISDTVEIKDSDVTGLNMGLKPNDTFDIGVKSYVSKIKVKTSKGTEEYEYDDDDLSKVEIASKYIDGAEVTATFIIKVSNNGNVSGYVTAIKNDTLGGWTFNEAQNRNWTVGEDGSLYCLSLEDVELEPGKDNEIRLILSKTLTGNDTGIYNNTVKISGTTNELQLEDKNTENNEANTDIMIMIKTGIKSYIIIGILGLLIFIILVSVINLKLLDRVDKKGKRKINIILILLFILLMISIYAIKSQAYIFQYKFDDGTKGERTYKWCMGYDGPNDTNHHSTTTIHYPYKKLSNYLASFYSPKAKTRSQFLAEKAVFRGDTGNAVRTGMCIHDMNITPMGTGTISQSLFTFKDEKKYRAVSVVDAGYNNNSNTKYFNTMYGDYVPGLYKKGNPNKLSSLTTNYEAQTLAYIGWALESDVWAKYYKTSRNYSYPIYQFYKRAVPNTMIYYPAFKSAIAKVSGVNNTVKKEDFYMRWYIETYMGNIKTFNTQNASVFGASANNINQDTLNIKDYNNNNKLKLEKIGTGNYITGIRSTFPVSGLNDNIKNRVYLEYSINGGAWTRYTGNIYVRNGNSVVAKAQNATYGLNTTNSASSNPFLKKNICIPASVAKNNYNNFRVRIRNNYYTYYSRTIFLYAKGRDQSTGITRGTRTDATRSQYIYRLVPQDDLRIEKHVYKIDGVNYSSTNKYGETGSTIRYSVKITNKGSRALKNIVFTDSHGGQQYVRCTSLTASNNGGTFTYTGSIAANKSVTVYIDYKITKSFTSSDLKVNNSVEVTSIKASDGSNVYTKGNSNTTLASKSYLKSTSEWVYIRRYSSSVDKYIYSIDGTATSSRKTNKKTQLYADCGSTVVFAIDIANTGSGASYGNIKNYIVEDTFNNKQLKYVGAHSSKTKTYIASGKSDNWTITNNSKNSKLTLTYTGTIAPGGSARIYIKFTSIALDTKSITVTNTAKLTTAKNKFDYTITANKSSSDSFKSKIYSAGIDKYIYSIGGSKISGRKTNKKTTLYADYGSTVVYAIDISNTGSGAAYGNIKNYVVEDSFNNKQLTYVGAKLSSESKYIAGGKSGKLTITNNSKNSKLSFTYTGTIAPGGSVRIYVQFISDTIGTKSIKVTNTAKILSAKNKYDYAITANKQSSDSFNSKTYNATIDKMVWEKSWEKSRYAEVGDNIIYRISIKNNSSGGVAGVVKNITIKDILSNNKRKDGKNYLEYVGFQGGTTKGTYVKSGTSDGWKISAVSNNGFNITYTKSISAGKSAYVYIKFKVSQGDTTSKTIKNTATRTAVQNSIGNNSKDITNYVNGTKESSANVTLKIYSANVLKYIYKVSNNVIKPDRSKDKSKEVTIEGGDVVEYRIVVTNDGTNSNKYGSISNFVLLETYPTKVFELVSGQNFGKWTRNGNKYTYNGSLAPGKSTTLTLKLKVVGVDASLKKDENGDIKIENIASLENQVVQNKNKVNINKEPNKILNGKLTDSDSAVLLISRLEIAKYITKLNNVSIADRSAKSNSEKFDNPVEVEKNNSLIYRVEIKNVGRTVISKMYFKDTLDAGIEFDGKELMTARVYTGDKDTSGKDIKSKVSFTGNASTRNINYEQTLEGNQRVVLEFKCKVTKTNLYLLNLKNDFAIQSIKNKVDYEIYNTPFLDLKRYDNQDYIRLKDLVVSGTIWNDKNLNGLLDDGETGISGVKVTLYDVTNGKKATVTSNKNGKYKFNETNGEAARSGATNLDKKMVLSDNRVIKATNKNQKTGNYDNTSTYINYYLEFEYNGGKYETTPVYANDTHIEKANNAYITPYEKDSNAAEYSDLRETFNNRLETVSYNLASSSTGDRKVLEYDKNGHESIINIKNDTAASMFAYSFANISKKGADGIQNGDLRYLWFKNSANNYDGETDYLKFINMGLTERKFDLKIEQDVYAVKNTINGQEMTYNFNQRDVSSEFGGEYILGGERADYSSNPYQFRLYNSDYYYNSNLYSNDEVKLYKKNTELNTEVTFRVKVTNEDLGDDKEVYSTIREIADYYSNNFMKVNTTKVIKKLDADGYLENIDPALNAVEAWIEDGTNKIYLTVSDRNVYGEAKNFSSENYSTLYITGFRDGSSKDIKLKEGESFEFYIKFIVDTDATGKIKIGQENNVVEINAYSTYKKNDKPAGYIDRDSNPGNVTKIGRVEDYEDDNYRSGIDLELGTKERTLSGFVWDDSRTESLSGEGTQYYADGKYDTSIIKNNAGKTNAKVEEKLRKNENTDIPVQDVKATMVEIIKMKDNSGNIKYYEEAINPWLEGGSPSSLTNESGIYTLTSFIPGKYETHFEYGYAVGDSVSQNMQVFNGHDYKSTKYNEAIDSKTADDDVLTELKKAGLSDARDDEIRRLEVIDYSEKMTNQKVENIQRTTSSNISEKQFAQDTSMLARTNAYKIKVEDVAGNINTYSYGAYSSLISGANPRYKVNNIDFGIEYRPETSLLLQKYISNIRVILSTGEDLVNIKYNYLHEGGDDTKITGTAIDKANSLGANNLQELRTVGNVKGFEYLNVDTDVLQGATIQIEYLLVASNESEIDRISTNLNGLMYRQDANNSYNVFMEEEYTASGTAKNQLIAEYYGDTYNTNNKYRILDFNSYNGSTGYYGKYLGSMYYTGNKGNDVVAKLKVDKILDYVDTDIAFYENENHSEDNYWQAINTTKLLNDGYIRRTASGKLIDTKGIQFSVNDGQETEMTNLAISVNDRKSVSDTNVLNKSISKYLLPSEINNKDNFGMIKLMTSKVLASETDTDNMRYDNISEIIQYTSQTGRATQMKTSLTPLGQTLGNVDPSDPTPPDEPDTSYTETITLAPPTGLDKANYYIRVYINYILVIIAIILLSITGVFTGRKIKNYKKFYK